MLPLILVGKYSHITTFQKYKIVERPDIFILYLYSYYSGSVGWLFNWVVDAINSLQNRPQDMDGL